MKIYEHQITIGDNKEAISVEILPETIRIAVADTVHKSPFIDEVQTTSIDLSPEAVVTLIEALTQSINEEGHTVLKLTGVQLRQIIESMKLSVQVLECEVNQADMPYDLIESLEAEFEALLQRDQSKKDA